MAYVKAEAIEQARRMDLLTYLSHYEPGNLVHISGNNYCTKEHDSLKISNGKWYWFSRGVGGISALDYLMKVKEYSFQEAVEMIVGRDAIVEPQANYPEWKAKTERKLVMPELVEKPYYAKKYLQERGIHPEIIQYCIDHSMLFETANYHNVVFVGYDKQGIVKYGAMRGTRSAYKGEVTGSDKRFSFSILETTNAEHIHLFESAIDLLSFATMELMEGRNWKQDALLSLAGVFQSKRNDGLTDVMVRAEDASKVNRIFERFGLATIDLASVKTQIEKAKSDVSKGGSNIPVPDRVMTDKEKIDKFIEGVVTKEENPTAEKQDNQNPTMARTTRSSQSERSSESKKDRSDADVQSRGRGEGRPSVREELKDIRKEQERKNIDAKSRTPEKAHQHVSPPKKKAKGKERR